jgi:hypothetical protein
MKKHGFATMALDRITEKLAKDARMNWDKRNE